MLLISLSWISFITVILSIVLIFAQGILIPLTVGVSVILLPVPLIVLIINSFLIKYIRNHPDYESLPEAQKQKIKTCHYIMKVSKLVVKVVLIMGAVCIALGALIGGILLILKKNGSI